MRAQSCGLRPPRVHGRRGDASGAGAWEWSFNGRNKLGGFGGAGVLPPRTRLLRLLHCGMESRKIFRQTFRQTRSKTHKNIHLKQRSEGKGAARSGTHRQGVETRIACSLRGGAAPVPASFLVSQRRSALPSCAPLRRRSPTCPACAGCPSGGTSPAGDDSGTETAVSGQRARAYNGKLRRATNEGRAQWESGQGGRSAPC